MSMNQNDEWKALHDIVHRQRTSRDRRNDLSDDITNAVLAAGFSRCGCTDSLEHDYGHEETP